ATENELALSAVGAASARQAGLADDAVTFFETFHICADCFDHPRELVPHGHRRRSARAGMGRCGDELRTVCVLMQVGGTNAGRIHADATLSGRWWAGRHVIQPNVPTPVPPRCPHPRVPRRYLRGGGRFAAPVVTVARS